MTFNLLILISYYLLILISILGYGLFSLRLFEKRLSNNNFGYVGLFGIYILPIYSYLSNFILAHSEVHNILLIILGIILFIINIIKNYSEYKKEILFTFIAFFLIFSSLLLFKNHDDFPYYHFPYTYYLTQQSFYFGVGQFNHGFRTPSSIFYLNSLFYLPSAKFYLFNFTSIYILGFANIVLVKKIHNYFNYFKIQKQKINFINYLSLLSLVFINIFFYRLAEHGTDRSAQILVFLLVIELLALINVKKIKGINLFNIYLLGAIIISLKAFFILYVALAIPLFVLLVSRNKNYIKAFSFLFFNRYFALFLLLLFFVLFSYFVNTGCIIYPLSITCFENLSWSIPITEVQLMNNWYELWSKAGAAPNFRVENPEQYIKGFYWVGNWIDSYFFTKGSDFVGGLIVQITIVVIFFKKQFFKEKIFKVHNHIYLTYMVLAFLGLEWFYNHPALRYGGYCIVALLFFIPISLKFNTSKINQKKYTKSVFILILITISIFNIRNYTRIVKEINFYNYNPIKKTFYFVDDNYFRIQKEMNILISQYENCKNLNNTCNLDDQKIFKKYRKFIFKNQ